jgi:hypothetical protein
MITQREQFHDFRIGERVTTYSLQVQSFLNSQAAQFTKQGADPVTALKRAYKTLQSTIQLSSFVMAFSECFLVMAIVILSGSAVIWFCRKGQPDGDAAAG